MVHYSAILTSALFEAPNKYWHTIRHLQHRVLANIILYINNFHGITNTFKQICWISVVRAVNRQIPSTNGKLLFVSISSKVRRYSSSSLLPLSIPSKYPLNFPWYIYMSQLVPTVEYTWFEMEIYRVKKLKKVYVRIRRS